MLLHPDSLQDIPIVGNRIAQTLETRIGELAAYQPQIEPGISVVIRTLNEADQLEGLFADLDAQSFNGETEVIIVDNESTDRTTDLARVYGAEVINLSRDEFTYPRSLNLGMEAASFDTVLLTVGHAALSNDVALRAGVRHFADNSVSGVFARVLPGSNASAAERIIAMGNLLYLKSAHPTKKANMGVMAAQGAMISKEVWNELGKFDERFETGSEDLAMARNMLNHGYTIVEDPVIAVHHTHGLGPLNTARQWKHWINGARGPQRLDKKKLARRRPDLHFD